VAEHRIVECGLYLSSLGGHATVRWLVAGLSVLRLGFDPSSVHVRLLVNRLVLRQSFLLLVWFYPSSITPPVLRTHLRVNQEWRTYGPGHLNSFTNTVEQT